jgi:hypothetical protein
MVWVLLRLASRNNVSWRDAGPSGRVLCRDRDPSKKKRVCGRVNLDGCVVRQDQEPGDVSFAFRASIDRDQALLLLTSRHWR